MSDNLTSKYALVCDRGLFFPLAQRLTREFGKVGFHPLGWNRGFPTYHELDVGKGFDDINHIQNLFEELEKVDKDNTVIIFPDIGDGWLQVFLRKRGFRVFGSGNGDELEMYRHYAKEIMQAVGLPVGEYTVVTGITALRKELKAREGDAHVKISLLRGITETFKALEYWLIKQRLDRLQHELGERAELTDFIVEGSIPTEIEYGYDGYCIDGKFPGIAANGLEKKDVCYGCVVQDYKNIPEGMRTVNEALAEVLKRYNYRNFFSTEIRVAEDDTPYLIDLTCRHPSPAGECETELWSNLGEIIWNGAEGKLIEPVPSAKYAIQSIIYSDFADENWQGVKFPEKYRDNIKLYYHTKIDGHDFVIPQVARMNEIGSIVTIGDDLEKVVKENQEIAETIEGDKVEIRTDKIPDVMREFEEMEKRGMDLTPVEI